MCVQREVFNAPGIGPVAAMYESCAFMRERMERGNAIAAKYKSAQQAAENPRDLAILQRLTGEMDQHKSALATAAMVGMFDTRVRKEELV